MRFPVLNSKYTGLMFFTALNMGQFANNDNRIAVHDQIPILHSANLSSKQSKTILAIEPPQTVTNGTFYIMNCNSAKSLEGTDQNKITQSGGTGAANQQWILHLLKGNYYSIINSQNNRALTATKGADANTVTASDYTGATNQQWKFTTSGSGHYLIVNRANGKALEVPQSALNDGSEVSLQTSGSGENQQWILAKTKYNGQVTWHWTSTEGVPADAVTRITNAMNDACARYNAGADWEARMLNVSYNPGVPTADANVIGNIRFGANPSFQSTRTAMHEMGHCYGVGQTGNWSNLTDGGTYSGANGIAAIKAFETQNSKISGGGGHFWPYGLNYDNEWSEAGAFRHVKIVRSMDLDGVY